MGSCVVCVCVCVCGWVGGSACVCVRVRVLNVHVSVCARMHFVVYVHTVCALQNIVFQRNEKERYSTQHSTQHKSHSTPASLGSSERAPTCRMSTYSCPPMHARAHTHTPHTHEKNRQEHNTGVSSRERRRHTSTRASLCPRSHVGTENDDRLRPLRPGPEPQGSAQA